MPTIQIQADPVYSLPFTYISGLQISYATTTTITIGAGQCRDSNDVIDIPVGAAPLNGVATAAPITINAAVNGINGLDTGTFAATSGYYVFVIADSTYENPVAALISLSATAPTMPSGYDSFRVIGWVRTGATAVFDPFDMRTGSQRYFQYRTPIVMAAGTATTSTSVNLVEVTSAALGVPATNLGLVYLDTAYTPTTAGNVMSVKGYDAAAVTTTASQYNFTGTVSAQAQNEAYQLAVGLNTGVPAITYLIATAGTQTTRIVGYTMTA